MDHRKVLKKMKGIEKTNVLAKSGLSLSVLYKYLRKEYVQPRTERDLQAAIEQVVAERG